ncbi:extracellular catalytic domain type 1 short-chain-length polyhydroxyalkanoate depolymerase [Teichococcus aestuarii]|uniref:extracellular catalytic domain type 1 short-chain-length polyhydroxyalkanoate depolymerase n=1 Tax=Teichococcus aestuarii TaxID=568898 RepID=UPI001FE2E446|nr:PHB depolymerase family esterase [Pseudoroseomonas aestuarii]
MTVTLALHGLDRLIRLRQRWSRLFVGAPEGPADDGRLNEIADFGENPGALRMLVHVPAALRPGAPLVVALHGCTQTAAGYDRGCGWSAMADRLGFALLLPEQRSENNPKRCFNWFAPDDTRRDSGEAASIRQMVDHMLREHRLDPHRVFVTGLSAGGGMSSALLACYPEVFAAGAILAGLPHGAAASVPQAFEAMFQPKILSAEERAAPVRAASGHAGPWPRISVWQGAADRTVAPANADEILKQWLALHGQDLERPAGSATADGVTHRLWLAPDGRRLVEAYSIDSLAHGVPLHPPGEAQEHEGRIGEAGPYMLDVGLSSTHAILDFWGLAPAPQRAFVVSRGGEAREVTERPSLAARLLRKARRLAGLGSD